MKTITAYCLDWHITNSDAFRDLIVDPLKESLDIKLTAWDGDVLPKKPAKNEKLIFCMLPPPQNILARTDLTLIWIPMWDQAQGYSDTWWNNLPKNLKVVAFSDVIHQKALAAGLKSLHLSYYKNPNNTTPVVHDKERVLLYWNRVGMVGPEFITKLCEQLKIDTLIFKPDIDPGIEDNKRYELPSHIGKTKIETIHTTKSREDFLRLTERANIVLSPRLTEGAGMFYLEAMSRGCVVIAHNAPTMSEYITHGKNGILLSNQEPSKKRAILSHFSKQKTYSYAPFLLSDQQPWGKIARLKLSKLGQNALSDHIKGYAAWQAAIQKYAHFLQED